MQGSNLSELDNSSVPVKWLISLLPKEAFDLPRWIPDQTGPYDLSDPYDNHFAFAKAQANFSGDYYWLAQYGWILICSPSEPAYPFLGRLTLATVFVKPTDPSWAPDVGEVDYRSRTGLFSAASP